MPVVASCYIVEDLINKFVRLNTMSKKSITIVIIVLLALGGLFYWMYQRASLDDTPLVSENESSVDSFDVVQPNLILRGKHLASVEVFAVPTGTNVSESDYISLGKMILAGPPSDTEVWTLPIPETPLLVTEIFAVAQSKNGVIIPKKSLPFLGATELYEALWVQTLTKSLALKVGESSQVEDLTIKLVKITEDSRCPVDVQCIQAGTVGVQLELSLGTSKDTATFTEAQGEYAYKNYFLKIVDVKPEKNSKQTVATKDYVVTFSVTKDVK